MVAVFYLLALLAVGYSFADPAPVLRAAPAQKRSTLTFAALCSLLCLIFAFQSGFIDAAAASQHPLPSWFLSTLPLLFFAPDKPFSAVADTSLVEWAQVLSVAEVAVLLALYATMRSADCRRPVIVLTTVVTALVLSWIAFASSTTNVDLYLYVAHGLIWPQQYTPPNTPLPGYDAVINLMWGQPLLPSAYGPLWNVIAAGAVAFAHSFWEQALAIRLLGFGSVAVCVLCLYRLRGSSIETILFSLNPAIYDQYVLRAHNDLSGVALVFLAFLVRRRTWLAVLLVAAAGTIKLPLLLGGLIVFWEKPRVVDRLWPALSAVLVSLAASLGFGGLAYFRAIKSVYTAYDYGGPIVQQLLHLTLAAVAVAAVVLALWRRQFAFGADWSFAALGQYALPQYLAWCLPYVMLGAATPLPFLIAWPIANDMMTLEYAFTPFFLAERAVLIVALAVGLGYLILRRRRPVLVSP